MTSEEATAEFNDGFFKTIEEFTGNLDLGVLKTGRDIARRLAASGLAVEYNNGQYHAFDHLVTRAEFQVELEEQLAGIDGGQVHARAVAGIVGALMVQRDVAESKSDHATRAIFTELLDQQYSALETSGGSQLVQDLWATATQHRNIALWESGFRWDSNLEVYVDHGFVPVPA